MNIGASLAEVHDQKFDTSGFFNEKLEIENQTSNFGLEIADFTISNLSKVSAVQKMGPSLNSQVVALVQKYRSELGKIEETTRLVHFDFNPKNIIVSGDDVEVILDWEYAASGSPLADIANFFRFEEDYSKGFLNAFIEGYESINGKLPENWNKLIRIIDLASMSNFITRSEKLDASSQTSIKIFKKTVNYFEQHP